METQNVSLMPQRIESLDALRGLDLFFLVAFGPFARTLIKAADLPCLDGLYKQLSHVQWEGFAVWDLIMPLFLFMSGITIPFAFSRMKQERDKRALTRRLTKRVLLLWIFGMIVQGNLLGLDPDHIYFYTNTLQTIAVGYLASALFFFFTSIRTQILSTVALLLVYWAAMQWITIDGFGGGDYTQEGNLAEGIDRIVMGRFRDSAELMPDGTVAFAKGYYYTWLLSSLNFIATVDVRDVCRIHCQKQADTRGEQSAPLFWNRRSPCRFGLVVGNVPSGYQDDLDKFHGFCDKRILLPFDGCVLLLDRL